MKPQIYFIENEGKTLQEWCDCYEIKRSTVVARLSHGWSVTDALAKPASKVHSGRKCVRHGMYHSHKSEYRIWSGMKVRCENPNCQKYKSYGERGIYVCSRWQLFSNFIEDMGRRPSKDHSIERIDNDGPYSPENCKWIETKKQARNQQKSRFLTYRGETKTVAEWAEITGIKRHALIARIDKHGWDIDKALSTPTRRMNGVIRKNT